MNRQSLLHPVGPAHLLLAPLEAHYLAARQARRHPQVQTQCLILGFLYHSLWIQTEGFLLPRRDLVLESRASSRLLQYLHTNHPT